MLLILIAGLWFSWKMILAERKAEVRSAVAIIEAYASAIDMFKADNGFYPFGTNGLNDLVVKPTNATADWHQYVPLNHMDPWGHPYLYVSPGLHNTNSYDLSSIGPDGIPGTADDIKNWQ